MPPMSSFSNTLSLPSKEWLPNQLEMRGTHDDGTVTDYGDLSRLNLTSPAAPYTHSLKGVSQGLNYLFVNALAISFLCLMGAVFLYRSVYLFNAHIRRLFTLGRKQDQSFWRNDQSITWPTLKKHLLYAPLGRVRHNREIQLSRAISIGTLPSRFQSLLLIAYLSCNLAYCLVLDYRQPGYAVCAELRGRTGVMAAINLIPTILFALRNNPLIWILGISYDAFNLLHRWCARMMAVEVVAHTICWLFNEMQAGGGRAVRIALATSGSYKGGMISTCVFTFIVMTAAGPMRHAFYEAFLNAHRLLVLLGIIGVYVHLARANLPQLPYLYVCIVLWCCEYFMRVYRLIYHNLSRRHGTTKVTIEALPSEACRVTFEVARPWRFRPGCHVHAYIPTFAWWSSHPFSIAWTQTAARGEPVEFGYRLYGDTKEGPSDTTVSGSSYSRTNNTATIRASRHVSRPSATPASLPQSEQVTRVSLVCRARTGMTKRLYEEARKSPSGIINTWGAIEGPYGGNESLTSFGTVVLFAGGVGVTHCISYIQHLLEGYQEGTSSTRRILFVWSVPTPEALEWIRPWMDQVLAMPGRREVLRIQLYITKPRSNKDHISTSGTLEMHPGRCNPKTVLEKEMKDRVGAVGVTVCGPGAFADSVRQAVRTVVDRGSIDFVEEAFTY